MSVSNKPPAHVRAGGWRAAVLGTVAAIALCSHSAYVQPAFAQSEPARGPVVLLPPSSPDSAPLQEPAPAPLSPTIAIKTLERIETDRIGLIDEGAGALPADMWNGSDPAFVRALLRQLPHQMPSLAMRRLAHNLLLPPSRQPEEKTAAPLLDAGAPIDPGMSDSAASTWLLEARLDALGAMGDWASVVALSELVPQDRLNENIIRARIDGLLIEGKTEAACNEVRAAMMRQPQTQWQKAQVFCQWANKQASAAQLGLSLLREEGLKDPVFFWAADVMQGLKVPTPEDVKTIAPLELSMLRLAGQPFPDALVLSGDPTVLGVLTSMPPAGADEGKGSADEKRKRARQHAETQIVLAERAVALGVLDPKNVADLYAKLDLSKDPAPTPLADATLEKVSTRAYVYQLVTSQTVPSARAEVLARVIDMARADRGQKGPSLVTIGRIYAPLIAEFEPSPDLIWFAGHAARGLMAAGQREKAQSWFDLAAQMARGSMEAANVADGLWAINHLTHVGGPRTISAQRFRAWQASLPAAKAAALREDLLNLLVALGHEVPPDEWLSVIGSTVPPSASPAPPSYIWHGLSLAAGQRRSGEVTALSLIALGEAGPNGVAAITLGKAIESLKAVGREADARALATEAALVLGL